MQLCHRTQGRFYLDRGDMSRQGRQQRGQIAAASADFQNLVAAIKMQLLYRARLQLGLPHGYPVT